MSKNELMVVSEKERNNLGAMFDKYSGLALAEMNSAEKALVLSEATIALRDAFTPAIMSKIMSLMDKPYGFKTDRAPGTKAYIDKGPYDENTVRDVMVCGVLYDLKPTGNELNIIANNIYATKEAFTRKVREIPTLTDLKITFCVPQMKNGGAIVQCSASWIFNGIPGNIGIDENDKCEIPVRVNSMMGTDAILGKAERKLKKRIYDRITGTENTIPEGDAGEVIIETGATVIDPSPKAQKLHDELNKRKQPPEPTPEEIAEADAKKEELKAKLEQKPRPDAYVQLSTAYDVRPDLVDESLAEVELPCMLDLVWQDLDESGINKLKRAYAKYVKKISE